MAQFDSLIIFPLICSLLFVLVLHYNVSIEALIPAFFGVKKFREKKLDSASFYGLFNYTVETKADHSYMSAS